MTEQSPFANDRDQSLGVELRAALDTADTDAFIGRLKTAVANAGAETSWDVLAAWAPRGLVAAVAAAVLIWLIGLPSAPQAPAALMASAPIQIEVAPSLPEAVVITVAVMEGR
jgi:hypothetical protein